MTTRTRINGAQYTWIGYALGLACMAGPFIRGLASGTPGLLVMSSSVAALLCAVWAATSAVSRRKAR